ncbi:hypothetical protein Aperf_G00000004023 [Anoplocephala perfoliata]
MTVEDNSTYSDKEIDYSHWLIFGPLSCPVAILGFIGNYLTLLTLSEAQLSRMNSSVFLEFLSIADAATIFFYFISFSIPVMSSEEVNNWLLTSVYYQVIYPLALIAQTCGVYTVVLFSIVRYITICHPFGLYAFRTRRTARVMVSCIFAFAVIFNLPRVFEHVPIQLRVFNVTCNCTLVQMTSLSVQSLYIKIYVSYGYTFGIFVIPVCIVSILNARLGILLHRVRRQFSEKKDDERTGNTRLDNIERDQKLQLLQDGRSENSESPFCRRSLIRRGGRSSTRMTHGRFRVTGRLFCLVSVFIAFQTLPMIDNLIQAFMSDLKAIIPNYDSTHP